MEISQLKKLANKVNYRIKSMQNLTGMHDTFSVKQLTDKLSANVLNALTPSGRVSVKKGYSELQQKAIVKAINEFLDDKSINSVRKIKSYVNKVSEEAGRPLSYRQANIVFQARKDYKWIYEYLDPSDYWGIVNEAREKSWTFETFSDEIQKYMVNATIDEEFKKDLQDLYKYSLYGV